MKNRKRLFVIWTVITVAIHPGCRSRSADQPAAFFSVHDHQFNIRAGIMYMDGAVFTGLQLQLYPNADTASIISYNNGREDGSAIYHYENGGIKEQREFKRGRKTGTHKGWWPSGAPRFVYEFDNDVYDGVVKEWYESGQLLKDFHYTKGVETGMQKQYFRNGSLQFNYEARNGRQYGLTGIKNCVNARDSIVIH